MHRRRQRPGAEGAVVARQEQVAGGGEIGTLGTQTDIPNFADLVRAKRIAGQLIQIGEMPIAASRWIESAEVIEAGDVDPALLIAAGVARPARIRQGDVFEAASGVHQHAFTVTDENAIFLVHLDRREARDHRKIFRPEAGDQRCPRRLDGNGVGRCWRPGGGRDHASDQQPPAGDAPS